MARTIFHTSIEGAQHGGKSLDEFVAFAKKAGANGAGPSNYHVQKGDGFMSAKEIKDTFEKHGMKLDGISAHCPFWAHTTIWTGSKTVRPFLPESVRTSSLESAEKWMEDYLLRFMDLSAEVGSKIIPMFWGVSCGFELATGYPFGFFQGPGYDLETEALDRFIKKTEKLRKHARGLGLKLCHEIHPNTAAMCVDDYVAILKAVDGDECMGVTADPSHCWEGEDMFTRFRAVKDRCYAAAVKNFVILGGRPLRKMQGDWKGRAMQFTDLSSGDMNMMRFVELLVEIGYAERYCKVMGTSTAPLVTEAESAHRDLDATAINAIQYCRDNLVWPVAGGTFEDGMGA
ncbi:MAG: hypothetical protein RJA70_4031 [Pseudomonadota bacterium]|jgi:sugar phosphate isomerase/epimerase